MGVFSNSPDLLPKLLDVRQLDEGGVVFWRLFHPFLSRYDFCPLVDFGVLSNIY